MHGLFCSSLIEKTDEQTMQHVSKSAVVQAIAQGADASVDDLLIAHEPT